MKCRLCGKFFNVESSFMTLFAFPEICPICTNKYQPIVKQELIPINMGELNYIYIYDIPLNLEYRNYLDRHLKLIYIYLLSSKYGFDLIIFIDNNSIKDIEDWGNIVNEYERVVFFSLNYYDFSIYNFLY
ncbi:MAG: hypothetical protein WCS32_02010 [Candidatus Izemoplasmatales bacterium]